MCLTPRAGGRRIALTLATTLLGIGVLASPAFATYNSTVIGDGPIAFYKLDEAAGATTASNAGSLGTAADGAYRNNVRNGRQAAIPCERRTPWNGFVTQGCQANGDSAGFSAYFAGAPYNAQVAVSTVPESPSYTLEAWVKPTEAASDGGIVDHGQNGSLFLQGGKVKFVSYSTGGDITIVDPSALTPNAWHHVVATYDNGPAFPGTSSGTLYVDGVQVGTDSGETLDAGATNGAPSLYIGWTNREGAGAFRGYIDNVALYGDDIAGVAGHYGLGSSAPAGTGAVTSMTPESGSAFSTQTDLAKVPLHRLKSTCSVACTYTLTRNPGAVLVSSGPANGLDTQLPLTAGTYTFVVDTGAGYTATSTWTVGTFAGVIGNDSPAAWWRFDELDGDLLAADSSGHGLSGYYQNPSSNGGIGISGDSSATRKFLAGEGGYVGVNDVTAKTEAYTIELWFKTADGDPMALFDHGAHGGGPALYLENGLIKYRTVDGQILSTGYSSGTWTHVAATWDGVEARLFKDGVGGSPITSTLSPSGTPALYLGFANVGLQSPAFRGLMDEVSYYGKALDSDQVFNHYLADPPPPAAHAASVKSSADSSAAQTPAVSAAAPDKSVAAKAAHAKAKARATARAKAKAKALKLAKARAKAKRAHKARSHRRSH